MVRNDAGSPGKLIEGNLPGHLGGLVDASHQSKPGRYDRLPAPHYARLFGDFLFHPSAEHNLDSPDDRQHCQPNDDEGR